MRIWGLFEFANSGAPACVLDVYIALPWLWDWDVDIEIEATAGQGLRAAHNNPSNSRRYMPRCIPSAFKTPHMRMHMHVKATLVLRPGVSFSRSGASGLQLVPPIGV